MHCWCTVTASCPQAERLFAQRSGQFFILFLFRLGVLKVSPSPRDVCSPIKQFCVGDRLCILEVSLTFAYLIYQ